MDKVAVTIQSKDSTRASEIIADLRTVAETLYFPMKLVGFWDNQADIHLCPQEERKQECPHKLPDTSPRHLNYALMLQRERGANLEVSFPHARVKLYLA